jgi:hypothetical protein
MFQVSASIPRLSPETQRQYWRGLLHTAGSTDPTALEKTCKDAESEALKTVENVHTQEELEAKIDQVRQDPVQEQEMLAAAAKQITRGEAQRETQHTWPEPPLPPWGVKSTHLHRSAGRHLPWAVMPKYLKDKTQI